MKAAPAFQFYPSDWLRDPALRACSLAARGLWIDMLCLMHEAEPYGHLKIGRKQIDAALLGRMVGFPEGEVKTLLAELEAVNVFSRTDDKTIFSRRMIRDEELRAKRRAAGKQGGHKTQGTLPLETEANGQATPEHLPKQVLEQTSQQKVPPSSSSSSSPSSSPSSSDSSSSSPSDKTVSSDEENPTETGEFEEAKQLWNATAGRTGLPTIRKLGPERRKKLRRRLKECGGLKGWAEACQRVEESAFLRGENKDGWAASFDFLLKPTKLLRVLEGTYADKAGQNKQQRVEKQSIAAARNWASRPQQGAEA